MSLAIRIFDRVQFETVGIGFLAGTIEANTRFADRGIRKVEAPFTPENLPHNLALVELLKRWTVLEGRPWRRLPWRG
jgi:hypothetical protein